MPSGANAASGAKHVRPLPRGTATAVRVQCLPLSSETCSAQEKSGESIRLVTTRFWALRGLRASVGELWALMSLRSPAPMLTGRSAPATRAAAFPPRSCDVRTVATPARMSATPPRSDRRRISGPGARA